MTNPASADAAPGSLGAMLRAIRCGEACSRSALAKATGLAPSTVAIRVETLIRLGLVEEHGDEASRGGRRARRLRLVGAAGSVAAVDIGAHHVSVGIADLNGHLLAERTAPSTETDPAAFAARLWSQIAELSATVGAPPLRGIGIGAPAPIEHPSGRIVHPSFMPSWDRVDLPALFADHTDAPVLVENDANLTALAEIAGDPFGAPRHLLAVKLGSRIGCGVVSDGRLHRGQGGAAGEVSHTPVAGVSTISCVCGVPNCLESVASGGALVARLRAEGYKVQTASEVLREAGASIGGVLASIVNFFNPGDVVLGGAMSASAPLVAAIRGELFSRCLPIAADDLYVRAAHDPEGAGIRGAIYLIIEEVLSAARGYLRPRG